MPEYACVNCGSKTDSDLLASDTICLACGKPVMPSIPIRLQRRMGTRTLGEISKINRKRAARWHSGGEEWTASDWSNALAGETGELCNQVKKFRRHETHVDQIAGGQGSYNTPPLEEIKANIRNEIADVFLYLDLVANHFGIDLEECIVPKFNEVSEAQRFPERL